MDRCLLLLAFVVLLCGAKAIDEPCVPSTDEFCDPNAVVGDPPVDDPTTVEPPVDDPTVDDPPIDDPTVDDPPIDDPTVDDPPVDDPTVDDPTTDDPPVDDPTVDDPPVDDPTVDDPPVDDGTEGEVVDPCASLNCKNGGSCIVDEGKAICLCPRKYDGKRCQRRKRGRRCPRPGIGVCDKEKYCTKNKDCRDKSNRRRRKYKCCRTACGGKQCYRV